MSGLVEVETVLFRSLFVRSASEQNANSGERDADIEPARSETDMAVLKPRWSPEDLVAARRGVGVAPGHNLTPLPQAIAGDGSEQETDAPVILYGLSRCRRLESGQGVADAGPSVEAGA